ncbi:MAG: methyltransferase domain-containing protein [Desulfovibrionaceae bacterium]|nr:methyltransferase domain-containing protein [Desulfovibrionaceae bacterium]
MRKLAGERKNYSRGISVACGTGRKEMLLLESGLVEHFDCWELSETAITAGKEEAKKRGLEERISFHYGDVFSKDVSSGKFDLVYWDNAMHHMFDTGQAMRWSRDALADSGVFYMYDYVGPTRFQWRDEQMEIVKNVLESWMTNIF